MFRKILKFGREFAIVSCGVRFVREMSENDFSAAQCIRSLFILPSKGSFLKANCRRFHSLLKVLDLSNCGYHHHQRQRVNVSQTAWRKQTLPLASHANADPTSVIESFMPDTCSRKRAYDDPNRRSSKLAVAVFCQAAPPGSSIMIATFDTSTPASVSRCDTMLSNSMRSVRICSLTHLSSCSCRLYRLDVAAPFSYNSSVNTATGNAPSTTPTISRPDMLQMLPAMIFCFKDIVNI